MATILFAIPYEIFLQMILDSYKIHVSAILQQKRITIILIKGDFSREPRRILFNYHVLFLKISLIKKQIYTMRSRPNRIKYIINN